VVTLLGTGEGEQFAEASSEERGSREHGDVPFTVSQSKQARWVAAGS
jgi:hypothetical protein